MSLIAVSVYRPHPGKENELLQVVREHYPVMRGQGLVTDRPPIIMKSSDGCIIEVMEWSNSDAIGEAHSNPEVGKLWKRFDECSKYNETLSSIPECTKSFASFVPLTFDV
jgi:hypothetical protein